MASSRTRDARPGFGLGISHALSRHAGGGDVCAQRGSDEKAGFSVAGTKERARQRREGGLLSRRRRSSGTRVAVRRDGRRSRRGGSMRAPSAPRRNLAPGHALSAPAVGNCLFARARLSPAFARPRAHGNGTGRDNGRRASRDARPGRRRARLTRNASSRTRTFYFANITSQGSDETRKTARRRPTRRRARRGEETARRETREERKNARTVRKRARWRADSWQTLPGVSARKDESVSSFLHKAAVGGGSDFFFRREIGSGS